MGSQAVALAVERGSPRERERDSTGRSGSRRRGGAGGREGGSKGEGGVLNSERTMEGSIGNSA